MFGNIQGLPTGKSVFQCGSQVGESMWFIFMVTVGSNCPKFRLGFFHFDSAYDPSDKALAWDDSPKDVFSSQDG